MKIASLAPEYPSSGSEIMWKVGPLAPECPLSIDAEANIFCTGGACE